MGAMFDVEKKPMTETDRLAIGAEHAKRQIELEALKEEKKDVTAVYRVKIRELEEKIHTLAAELDAGEFDVKFEVVEVPDDERMVMAIERKDTHELVKTRPMTEGEKEAARKRKQTELFPPAGDDGPHDTEPAPPRIPRPRNGKKKNGKR